jgi:AAA15 family ATPase/GTPase
MIVSFSVSNFRSFLKEETLSLVASNRLKGSHDEHTLPIPGSTERVLRTAVIYGANGAGKSNLFKALWYMENLALGSRDRSGGTGREAFRFADGAAEPSTFDLQFIVNDKLYRYGFEVDDQRVTEEWLVRVEGGREKPLYERTTNEKGEVSIDSQGLKGCGEKLRALATVGGPQNQSFLATINVTLDSADIGEELNGILFWFKRGLDLIKPDASFRSLCDWLAEDSNFNRFAGEFLKSSSTGVDHLSVVKNRITEAELRASVPPDVLGRVLKDISQDENGRRFLPLGNGTELLIEREKGEQIYSRITIQSVHEHESGRKIPLELADESDGTRRLLNLMPALHNLQKRNVVYFIDEIDRSLHPILVLKFLEFFLKSCGTGQRQIIVTTHESNLLNLDLLRRDEIWFAEKDETAATRLYSLSDFKVRKDLEIRKHYLQGRFGAIPFLASLDNLVAKQDCPE